MAKFSNGRTICILIVLTLVNIFVIEYSVAQKWERTFGGVDVDTANSANETMDGGYIVAGITKSFGDENGDIWLVKVDSSGNKEWDRTFGGPEYDSAKSVQQTRDGGYIIAGCTGFFGEGYGDAWLIKTDSSGNKEWDETFGGTMGDSSANSMQQTRDGGYIIAGYVHDASDSDVLLIKVDSLGSEEWNMTFGGSNDDGSYSVEQTRDEGYIIAGYTKSYDANYSKVWIIKTDSLGNREWDRTFQGSTTNDVPYLIRQTNDSGYIIVGRTKSHDVSNQTKVDGTSNCYIWLKKTDSTGSEEWNRTFSKSSDDRANSIQQTRDGGYIIAGYTGVGLIGYSLGLNDIRDAWLIKTNSLGNKEWDKTFGGARSDEASSVQQTLDGGYVIAGNTWSYGAGYSDVWLIKTDADGNYE
jgi:hypothetical protein